MKVNFICKLLVLLCLFLQGQAQIQLPKYPDSIFTTYYHQRVSLFQLLQGFENSKAVNEQNNQSIIFLGNSINDGAEWNELFTNNGINQSDSRIMNRGISGDITAGVMHRLDEVAKRKPAKVFLMIGINDLGRGLTPDSVVKNILLINDYLQQESPATKIFIESILPVNPLFGKFAGQTSKTKEILIANTFLKNAAEAHQYTYIDLHSSFTDNQGYLDKKYTNDGLHLMGAGYQHWRHLIYPKVFGLTDKPALIPLPKQVEWKSGYYLLQSGKSIKEQVAILIENSSEGFERDKNVVGAKIKKSEVNLRKDDANESYELNVSESQINIKAKTQKGVYNAMQTLEQLARNGKTIDAVEIKDEPAFAWRGYMIDVGRNYLSIDLLKQQIDRMAKYKLNVFHFHASEDIAWRIESKRYPQLTSPEYMLRNKGLYYSEAEIKELIQYCNDRNILFVPEIDMPGHSAAFKRAMKTDMQSDSGLIIVKNILEEFCTTFDVPYIHIGADEVKITNPNFIPEVTKYIQSFGKKVIGWQPGGNFLDNTIRQLWMDDLGKITSDKQIQYIDSRHLYLNHMDPLEAVTTIFNRQLANKDQGDQNALGAIICTWHDRSVEKQEDVLRMNPVYPAMMAFAERSWKGGGKPGWIANISDGDNKAFAEFEVRLLNHRQQFNSAASTSTTTIAFPYQSQSHLQWKIYGPFAKAVNENQNYLSEQTIAGSYYKTVTGGTVVLRHWWAPLIKGAIDTLTPNTTVYAETEIWSKETAVKPFWIGFNNLSRSPATDSHPNGEWSFNNPTVWVNQQMIAPPVWKRGSQKGDAEIPLSDEGYEYRAPTMILLQKGQNKVRIKIPIKELKGKDWQNPAKYMFTFVPVE